MPVGDLRRWQNRVYRNGGGQWAGTGTCGKTRSTRDHFTRYWRVNPAGAGERCDKHYYRHWRQRHQRRRRRHGTGAGAKLCDANGNEIGFGGGSLNTLNDIDISGLDPRLKDCVIRVACDVTNPLVGDSGASRIFGPQREPVRR